MQQSIPTAAIRASLSAISRVWKSTGPEFLLEEIDGGTILTEGDFLLTVVFHLKETAQDTPLFVAMTKQAEEKLEKETAPSPLPKAVTLEDTLSLISPADDLEEEDEQEEAATTEADVAVSHPAPPERPPVPPQLCVSFVVSVAGKQPASSGDMLQFDQTSDNKQKEKDASVCFELFGNGSGAGEGFVWSFINDDNFRSAGNESPLTSLKIVSATSFRHRYVNLHPRWTYDRRECVERCWILTSIDMPFPHELIESNLDYLANFLMLGILIPETLGDDLADCVERQGLCRHAVLLEAYEQQAKLKPLKLTKPKTETIINAVAKLHHLAHVGHIGIIVESSLVVGGAAYDAVYDPQNLARNAKRRGKLATAATAGGIIGGVVGVLIPIPGLFIAFSVAGSMAGRWIAGKFITDEGQELPDVIPVGGVRSENDDDKLVEVVQDFDEDAPLWKKTWNRLTNPKKAQKQTSAIALIEETQSVPLVPPLADQQPRPESAEAGEKGDKEIVAAAGGGANSWPGNGWAQKASVWTTSVWSAIQQRATVAAASAPSLFDMTSAPPAPQSATENGKGKLSALPSDLFEPPKELPKSEELLRFEEAPPSNSVADERPADLLMFSFEEEKKEAEPLPPQTDMGRVKSSDLLLFQM